MLKSIRAGLTALGGVQVVLALGAIGWGLHTLQKVVEERTAYLDHLAQATAEREAELAAAMQRHPAGAVPTPRAAAEDLDPLGRGEDAEPAA